MGPPSRVDSQRPCASPRPQPVPDELAAEHEWSAGAALIDWPPALRDERTVRYAHGRELKDRPELKRQARSTWMIAAGCIDEQQVGQLRQRADGGLQE
jgi:hypothetical protein